MIVEFMNYTTMAQVPTIEPINKRIQGVVRANTTSAIRVCTVFSLLCKSKPHGSINYSYNIQAGSAPHHQLCIHMYVIIIYMKVGKLFFYK